ALAELIRLVDSGTINNNAAKKVLDALFERGGAPTEIVRQLGLEQTQDTALIEAAILKVLEANPAEVARFCNGEEKVLKFLIGQVMREGRGKFPAELTNALLNEHL
ncbi:MAG: Asp-tRNA(Asn)/Glu-tRNA(Gln) amidotransferase GatCAB subunit B, partial [Candidatus Thermofonsia Clade 1 bacterium]